MRRTAPVLLALVLAVPPAIADEHELSPRERELLAAEPDEAGTAGETVGDTGTPVAERAETTAAGLGHGETLALHLSDAVSEGIENNLLLQVERFDPLIAFEDQEGAWGSFDPLAKAEYDYISDTEPFPTNALQGSERNRHKENTGLLGLEALVPWLGASVGIDWTLNETQDIGSPFIAQRPVYNSDFTIQGTLPLLKGLIWNQAWTRVKTSAAAYEGSRENFTTDLMDVVQFIETAYWSLVAQSQAVRVAEKSLETARSLLDQTQTQYDVGVVSKVEVVEAEAGAAAREFDLIRAVNAHQRAQDDLIDAVYGSRLTAATRLNVVPADDPENYISYQIDTVEAAEKALENRPELAEAESFIEQSEFQLKFAENQWLPQLDLRATYGTAGRRGEGGLPTQSFDPGTCFPNPPPCTVLSATTGRGVDDALDDYWTKRGGETLTVGAVFSIPIGNISGRRNLNASRLELRKAKSRLTRLRQDIILDVREQARNLASAQEGIEAAERRRLAAAEQLRAEQVRLEYGESTPFRVLEKEQDLVEAENEKIAALFTYRRSVVDLHRAQGTILEARNIVVEEAATLR